MGYRSDVKILIKFDTEEQLTAFAVAQRLKGDEQINRIFGSNQSNDWEAGEKHGNKMTWHYSGIKWYDGYPFVQAWANLFREIEQWPNGEDQGEANGGWVFVRLGEELDDIVTDCGGSANSAWEYINVYTVSEFCD